MVFSKGDRAIKGKGKERNGGRIDTSRHLNLTKTMWNRPCFWIGLEDVVGGDVHVAVPLVVGEDPDS